MRVNEKQNWWISPTNVAYHFGTSGTAVAAATAITHPLGLLLSLRGCNFGYLGLVPKHANFVFCCSFNLQRCDKSNV